jgi:hypothetical protein
VGGGQVLNSPPKVAVFHSAPTLEAEFLIVDELTRRSGSLAMLAACRLR